LSVKLVNVRSNELHPYQHCETSRGNVKVNGKKMPYLNLPKDQAKLEKFITSFQALKVKYE